MDICKYLGTVTLTNVLWSKMVKCGTRANLTEEQCQQWKRISYKEVGSYLNWSRLRTKKYMCLKNLRQRCTYKNTLFRTPINKDLIGGNWIRTPSIVWTCKVVEWCSEIFAKLMEQQFWQRKWTSYEKGWRLFRLNKVE